MDFDFKSPLFRWFDFDFIIINIWWFCPSLNGIPRMFLLNCPFRNYTRFNLAVPNLLAHNSITISFYMEVNTLRLKSNVAWIWASKHIWRYYLFCCWEYHQQQKNGTPKGFYLLISKLQSILDEPNLLAHNNITMNYYVQVKFATAKIECSFEMGT